MQPPSTWPLQDDEVQAALAAAYADGSWGRYFGPSHARLVAELQQMHSVAHALPCSSGTIAVELALRGCKVGPGDEVILAAYDFPGNFRAVEAIGARPVLVDLKPSAWTLDENQLAEAFSPATKAVVVSHLHGSLANMQRIAEWAAERGVAMVEDACQTPGATVQGRIAGTWGDAGVLSFGGSKLLTAGRGGAVLTNRDDVQQRIKIFSDRGNQAFPLSELQAAVLLPQLPKLAARNAVRWQRVQQLIAACRDVPGLELLPEPDAGSIPAFYKLAFLLRPAAAEHDAGCAAAIRDRYLAAVQAAGVALDAGFRGFTRRGAARCRVVGSLPHAARAAAGTLVLHHPVLLESSATIAQVAEVIAQAAHATFTGESS
jgi:dTDP-4-amino-4,6-dideoxygalactose transaminase